MRRTKDEAERTREAILDAAETLFYENGVAGTSLAQIASAAGLTRGAIYWHFSGKLDLLRDVADRARLPQESFFRTANAEPPSVRELYDNTVEALAFLASDERAQRVMTILMFRCEYVGEMQPAMERRTSADEEMRAVIARIFHHSLSRRAMERGEGQPACDPRAIASGYFCAVSGLIGEWLKSNRAFDLVDVGSRVLARLVADHLDTLPEVVLASCRHASRHTLAPHAQPASQSSIAPVAGSCCPPAATSSRRGRTG
ncbi:TetR family transcriptional regulator [Fulvimarina endophytica]|uniref:TetR family transcriptional regulator n=1 Tax=Fulvimarina endophytica TaxID=2293836 RepID=A0A371X568_9HYPH|nr:TetR family transcriptional regulator [Fulvimarina endophytica]RFC64365.1 TetR family transcriptional regulator [Fulvimarina endophytica]